MRFSFSKIGQTLAALALAVTLLAGRAHGQAAPTGGRVVDLNAKGEAIATTATQSAAGADSAVSSPTLRLLRSLEAFHKDVKTIHATFDQVRLDEAFQSEVRSPGELWFEKPAHYRCDYEKPQPLKTLITDDTLYMYLPTEKQVEFYKYASPEERDQQLHQLLIVFGFNADELAKRYDIRSSEDDPALGAELAAAKASPEKKVIFQVRPRPAYEESCPFKAMKVTIDKASHLPDKIWYKDASDAPVTLMMHEVELDPKLPDGIFTKDRMIPAKGIEYIDKRNAQ